MCKRCEAAETAFEAVRAEGGPFSAAMMAATEAAAAYEEDSDGSERSPDGGFAFLEGPDSEDSAEGYMTMLGTEITPEEKAQILQEIEEIGVEEAQKRFMDRRRSSFQASHDQMVSGGYDILAMLHNRLADDPDRVNVTMTSASGLLMTALAQNALPSAFATLVTTLIEVAGNEQAYKALLAARPPAQIEI